MVEYICTMKETCCGKEHREGCPYFVGPVIEVRPPNVANELNRALNMSDEELKAESFPVEDEAIELFRTGLMSICDLAKAAYDSLDNDTINFLTAKQTKLLTDEVFAASAFFQILAGAKPEGDK